MFPVSRTLCALLLLAGLRSAPICAAENPQHDKQLAALTLMIDEPAAMGTERYGEAVEACRDLFEVEQLSKLSLPDEALAWVPKFGPCGGEGSMLLITFFASVMRDHLQNKTEGSIHRGWFAAIRHYRYLRATYPDDFTPEPTLEALIKKEAAGVLRQEGAELEVKAKASKPKKTSMPSQ